MPSKKLIKVHVGSHKNGTTGKNVKLITVGRKLYEPIFVRYLSPEILNAALIGSKYSAPSPSDVHNFIKNLCQNYSGAIIAIIPNNLEEVAYFASGLEKAKCEKINVHLIPVGDDCCGLRSHCLAGLTFVFLIAGAMTQSSLNINDICTTLKRIKMNSISCHLGKSFSFIGTNLDSGSGKYVNTSNLTHVISKMLNFLLEMYGSSLQSDNIKFLILLNIYVYDNLLLKSCVHTILNELKSKSINVVRIYYGNFVFGPRGFSITLIEETDSSLVLIGDAAYRQNFWPQVKEVNYPRHLFWLPSQDKVGPIVENTNFIEIPIKFACEAMLSSKEVFNKLDVRSDFGKLISPALELLLKKTSKNEISLGRPSKLFQEISLIFQDHMKNEHGSLFSALFLGISKAFSSHSEEVCVIQQMWIEALEYGVYFIKEACCIEKGELSFIDILAPFTSILEHKLISSSYKDLARTLGDILNDTNIIIERTYSIKSPKKKIGYPEVSTQAMFVGIIAVVQAIMYVMNTVQDEKS